QRRRRGIFAERTLVVLALDREIAGVHVVIRALQDDEAPQLLERLLAVVHAQIKRAINPRLPRRLAADDDERGGLTAANITSGRLGGIERGEHAIGEAAVR